MAPVITVEHLSKRYILSHQRQQRSATLNDAIATAARRLFSRDGASHDPAREEFWALNDVSFSIEQGDRVGIIGRNGAGKSTLLKILSRITEPTSGRVAIRGRVSSLLEVGTGFHPELSGRENIFLNGAILGMSKAEIGRRFDEIVAFAEVEKFLDTPVKRYSSGMYVRLAFAVAAHLEPEILIVDEVLAVGDAQFQKKCMGKMEDVGKEGRTVLFVSHSLPMVASLCNKGILLEEGRVIVAGAATDVIGYYTKGQGGAADIDFTDREVGDEYARLLGVAVLDGGANAVTQVRINEPVTVSISFEILKNSDREMMPKFHFAVEDGRYAFISAGTRQMKRYLPGRYRASCHIPANLLNQGMYSVGIGLVSYEPTRIVHFHEEGVIAFDVIDPLINVPTRAKGAPLSAFPGAVRPNLDWTVDPLN